MKWRKPATLLTAMALTLGSVFSLTGVAYADTVSYEIKNGNTGRCIDDSTTYGLRSHACNGTSYQQWKFYLSVRPTFVIKNANTGRCIDDSATYGLRSFGCNGQVYQQWYPLGPSNVPNPQGPILMNSATGRCIDDSFGSGLRSWPCNYLNYQDWYGFYAQFSGTATVVPVRA